MKRDPTKPSLHLDRDWLQKQLVELGRPLEDVADECGVSKQAVQQLRDRREIPKPEKRTRAYETIDAKWLAEQIANRRIYQDIADELSVSCNVVCRAVKAYKIKRPVYTPEERRVRGNKCQNKRYANDPELRARKARTARRWAQRAKEAANA